MLRNIIGIVVGIFVGTLVNIGLVSIGQALLPVPPGVDQSSMSSFAATIHLFEPKHFIFPFLAHAAGPLAGTFATMLIAVSHKMKIAIGMGIFFLLGGIIANYMIPAPFWFKALDLIVAYVPMALLGARLGARKDELRST